MIPRSASTTRMATSLVGLALAVTAVVGCGASTVGPASIQITAEGRVTGRPTEIALFVETGSASQECLATLQESQARSWVREWFCAHRTASFDGGATQVEGIWLHLFFAEDPGDDVGLWVTVSQVGARTYGTPLPCWVDEGCA